MTGPTPYTPPDGHIICIRRDVPAGWELRNGPDCDWYKSNGRGTAPGSLFVEARPVRQPDPRGVVIDAWFLSHDGGHADLLVTTVGEMRGRTDLDQWEYADNEPGCVGWTTFARMQWREQDVPAGFPVIVRRKDGGS